MKQSEPKCPYCGETMKIHVSELYEGSFAVGYAVCPACGSYGPSVKSATDEGVKRIHDDVKADVMRRPIQKPLPFHEFLDLIGPGHEVVTFCEAKGDDRTYASIWIDDKVVDGDGISPRDNISYETYGKLWRAWATRPTDEERAAAPWEE